MTNIDPAVAAFAALLAQSDEKERNRLLTQAKLHAVNQAPKENLAIPTNVSSLREYLDRPIEIPPSLVWPTIVVRGELTTTLGRAGKGKTTMNLNRIMSWAAGRALFPDWKDKDGQVYLNPEKPLKTLIAENEGNAAMFHQKMGLMLHHGPLSKEEREQALDNLFVYKDGGYSNLKLDNPEGVGELRRAIDACQPDIVFVEPFRSLWRGEENSATDMAQVVDNMVSLATEFQCGIILSHHERKSGTGEDGEKMSAGRGSTVLEGVVAVMENFESVKEGEYREMSWSKARYEVPPAPVRMEWGRDSGWYEWVPQEAIDDAIIQALTGADDEPMNVSALCEETGETKANLRKSLDKLVKDGKIKKMPSVSSQHGSTGTRYRMPSSDNSEWGGLAV